MENPEFLYHYTTVESLAMILSTKSIRFSPLTVLDDRYEEKSREEFNAGRFIFISSWMGSEEESIPMWKMYSDMERGVRIKLASNPIPFEKYQLGDLTGEKFLGIIPRKEYYFRPYLLADYKGENLLFQVEYTNDENKLNPKLETQDGERIRIRNGLLGKHKKLCWEFQKEWRYLLQFIPLGNMMISKMTGNIEEIFEKIYERYYDDTHQLPFSYYFLKIDDKCFSNMEITLSPKITLANRVIVESLKEKYNPKMKIINSTLQDDIR